MTPVWPHRRDGGSLTTSKRQAATTNNEKENLCDVVTASSESRVLPDENAGRPPGHHPANRWCATIIHSTQLPSVTVHEFDLAERLAPGCHKSHQISPVCLPHLGQPLVEVPDGVGDGSCSIQREGASNGTSGRWQNYML